MKRTGCMAAGLLILLGTMAANAQSLGELARSVRKTKPQPSTASRHYDNDNLPKDQQLNIVGPQPSGNSGGTAPEGTPANANTPSNIDQKVVAADRQKAAEELQNKIKDEKQKVDSLAHDLDLAQREYKLRSAVMYSDAGNRLRNAAQWDKDDAQYKQELADKKKALEAAQHDLDASQEEARKAGIQQKDDK